MSEALALTVGCGFHLESSQTTTAIFQVAPALQEGTSLRAERWGGGAEHRGYRDHYDNRCERFDLGPGAWQLSYEADVLLQRPADEILPGAPETPVGLLPDEVLSYVMPSRFCLPDELGQEAWDRFGALEPGWERVQAIVDFVHGHLEWVVGSSNPWTTAADAFRAGQGVCRDFAHLAITFCRALNIPARYAFGYIPNIGFGSRPRRWTSRRGSRPTSTVAGTPSTLATTRRASAAWSSVADAMRSTSRWSPRSGR